MSTQILVVPLGAPQRVFINQPSGAGSVCGQPGPGGTILLEYSLDGVTFIGAPQGASAQPYAIGTAAAGMGAGLGGAWPPYAVVRATASGAPGVMIVSDVAAFTADLSDGIAMSGVSYASLAVATEQNLFALRVPPGLLKANFRIDVDGIYSCLNSANAKTVKCYFGPVGGTLTGGSQVLTSLSGGRFQWSFVGRNDGQTVVSESFGATSATTPLVLPTLNYQTSEQEVALTVVKATAAEQCSLEAVVVRLSQ